MIRLNVEVALYRRNSVLVNWPVVEVISVSAITAAISYLVCSSIILPCLIQLTIPPDCFRTVIALFFAKEISSVHDFILQCPDLRTSVKPFSGM